MKGNENCFIACDWGTSSFRIRLINAATSVELGIHESADGVARIHKSVMDSDDRIAIFKGILAGNLSALQQKLKKEIKGLPIVISGMASSSIGMKEIAYASLPFDLSTVKDLKSTIFEKNKELPHQIILVSGIRDSRDVMRGEEVQLIGLSAILKLSAVDESLVILPGTHSKHCLVKKGVLHQFQTYMTGELFQIIKEHSILNNSVNTNHLKDWTPELSEAFAEGVEQAQSESMLANLFKVRTNILFKEMGKEANGLFLSGLLIGEELKTLNQTKDNGPIVICGGKNLLVLYKRAMQVLGLEQRMQVVSDDKATIAGQVEMYQLLTKNLR